MSVREFSLVNENGKEYSLMDIENYCALTAPSGLGYSYDTDYEQLGNTFVENVRTIQQGSISGTVHFSCYDNYANLVNFIETSEELKFKYIIPYKDDSTKTYYKDVNVKELTKTDKTTGGVLEESIEFDCLTLWYEENTAIYTIEQLEDEIRWNFEWDSRFTDYNSRQLQYINSGHTEAPVVIEIDGYLLNPRIELYVEGDLYQTVAINCEIAEYEKLLYCTKENEFYIQKQNTDGTTESLFNLDYIDFESDLVIRLPRNKSCVIKLLAENEVLNAQITVLPQFKAV